MKNLALTTILLGLFVLLTPCSAQDFAFVQSSDGNIGITLESGEKLTYLVKYKGREIIMPSPLGFELKGEPSFDGSLEVVDQTLINIHEEWEPAMQYCQISMEEYTNKVAGGWLGQAIAVLWGQWTEGIWRGEIVPFELNDWSKTKASPESSPEIINWAKSPPVAITY